MELAANSAFFTLTQAPATNKTADRNGHLWELLPVPNAQREVRLGCSTSSDRALPRAPSTQPAQPHRLFAPSCTFWPLPDPHSSPVLIPPGHWVNPSELFPPVLSPLAVPLFCCCSHPALLTHSGMQEHYSHSHDSGRMGAMPCGDVPAGQWPLLSRVRVELLSDPEYCSLQVPLDKASAPTAPLTTPMCSLFSSDKSEHSNSISQGLSHPPHLPPLLFFFLLATWGKISQLTHRNSYRLLSLPHIFCPSACPQNHVCLLPHLTCSCNLFPLSFNPATPLNNDPSPSMSATWMFSPPSKHYGPTSPAQLPLPQESLMRTRQYTARQGSFWPSAIHRGTFTAPLAVPSQHQRQRDGRVLRT